MVAAGKSSETGVQAQNPGWPEQNLELRQAVEREDLVVFYQPIVSLRTGRLSGFEALVRWQHALRGLVAPADFLPLAEELDLLHTIDYWVLRQACRQAAAWQQRFHLPLLMSVNVSGAQLADPELPQRVQAILKETALDPQLLKLEIVERTLIGSSEVHIRNLKHLRALGVQLSLDDFGTGYSSLSYLNQLPITTLKLDRSFISSLDVDQRTAVVVQAIVSLARTLGMEVIAEGVETSAQLDRLWGFDCSFAQGFLFAPPLDNQEAARLVRDEALRTNVLNPGPAPMLWSRPSDAATPDLELPATGQEPSLPEAPVPRPIITIPQPQPAPRTKDAMTGTWARETLPAYFEDVRSEAQRLQQPFALVVLDIDHFKSVNDAYGHARGDEAIIEFALRLMQNARTSDRIFRYGGDEFVAILPATDRDQAAGFAGRVLDQIGSVPFPGDPPLSLSTSIGIAIFPADGTSYEELFDSADRRNNQAKRSGRACAVVEDAPAGGTVTIDGPSRLIERDQALYELHRFIDELDNHQRAILHIAGMPGVGITRMLNETAHALTRRGYGILSMRGNPALRRRIGGALAEALNEVGEPAMLEGSPRHQADILRDRLASQSQRGLVILLDDLPDIDPDSLSDLRALFELSELECIALVYASPTPLQRDILPAEVSLQQQISLGPLSIEGLRAWLRHSLNREVPEALLIWLHNQTGGMPGFIRRALAYLVDQGLLQPQSREALYGSYLLNSSLHGRIDRTSRLTPSRLPELGGDFVGRVKELHLTRRLLATRQLVSIVGPGGLGKSRLAIQVAAEAVEHFPDGVFWVAASALSSGEFLVYAIADALGLTLTGAHPPRQQVRAHLQLKRLLLVIDGFEYLRESAPLLSELISGAPEVRIIVTSRDRLPVPEVVTVDISGLPYPDDEDEQLTRYEAIQLFVRSARRNSPDFDLTLENRQAIARICRLVEGMPLGIELAAGWVRTISCEQIADTIAQDIELLASSERASGQSVNLVAAIDYFWYMLSAVEQQTLQRIAIFRGGFTRAAAEHVAGASLFFLDSLVAKGYLRLSGARRYEAHELLRQYAVARLRENPVAYQDVCDSHSRYYLELLRQRDLVLSGSRHALAFIGADLGNVRVAWRWAVEREALSEINQSIAGMATFYDLSALFHEAATLFGQAAEQLRERITGQDAGAFARTVGHLLVTQARFLVRLSLHEEAIEAARNALSLTAAGADVMLKAWGHYAWGEALSWQGSTEAALARYRLALSLAQAAGEPELQSDALRKIGRTLSGQGRHAEARVVMVRALNLARASGDRQRESRSLNDLGIVADNLGDGVMAHDFYAQCLRLARDIGDRPGEGSALLNLGALALDQRRYADAEQCFEQALPIFLESSDRHNEAIILENFGDSARMQGDLSDAQHYYERALAIYHATGERHGESFLLYDLGLLAYMRGDYPRAEELAAEAQVLAQAIGTSRVQGNTLLLQAHLHYAQERYAEAGQLYEKAALHYQSQGQAHLATEAFAGLVQVALAQGDTTRAEQYAGTIAAHLEIGSLDGLTNPILVMLACARGLRLNQPARADALLRSAYTMLEQYAEAIPREDRRKLFLEQIPAHRELREEVRHGETSDSSSDYSHSSFRGT